MRFFAIYLRFLGVVFSAAFFFAACEWDPEYSSNYKSFAYELQGAWVPNDPEGVYTGSLKIDTDRITITGYGETQTPSGEDDNKRPFKGYTRGTALKGYSEAGPSAEESYKVGHIFIQDAGILQSGIPYTYWEEYSPSDYRRTQFLRFTFEGRVETLQKTNY